MKKVFAKFAGAIGGNKILIIGILSGVLFGLGVGVYAKSTNSPQTSLVKTPAQTTEQVKTKTVEQAQAPTGTPTNNAATPTNNSSSPKPTSSSNSTAPVSVPTPTPEPQPAPVEPTTCLYVDGPMSGKPCPNLPPNNYYLNNQNSGGCYAIGYGVYVQCPDYKTTVYNINAERICNGSYCKAYCVYYHFNSDNVRSKKTILMPGEVLPNCSV